MKRKLLLAVFCIFCISIAVQAQKMCLNVNYWSQDRFAVDNVSKITFPNGEIRVDLKSPIFSSTAYAYDRVDVKSLTFGLGNPTAIEEVKKQLSLSVYPNPTTDVIYVETLGVTERIQVYDYVGRLMTNVMPQGDKTMINMASYPKGLYLIKVGKTTAKVIKN